MKMNEYSHILIYPLSSSTQEGQYLLCYNRPYYEANRTLVELVKELQQHPTEGASYSLIHARETY